MKKNIVWITRILLAFLFLFSAFAKMYSKFEGLSSLLHPSIWMFEKTIVDVKLANWHNAQYLARFVLACEIAAGIAILQNRKIRSLVLPLMALLLVIFIGHLAYQIHIFDNVGNCGCFGQMIKMTPMEAIIKNIITLAMIAFVWYNVRDKEKPNNGILWPLVLFIASQIFMFVCFPMRAAAIDTTASTTPDTTLARSVALPAIDSVLPSSTSTIVVKDTSNKKNNIADSIKKATAMTNTVNSASKKDSIAKAVAGASATNTIAAPAQAVSKFAKYAVFANSNFNVDEGKKILCFFAPGCDHCQAKAKALTAMGRKIPPVAILFLDEEVDKIPEFFKIAGATYLYKIIDPATFFTIHEGNTPGVYALWNGNIIKTWEGTDKNEFETKYLSGIWGK